MICYLSDVHGLKLRTNRSIPSSLVSACAFEVSVSMIRLSLLRQTIEVSAAFCFQFVVQNSEITIYPLIMIIFYSNVKQFILFG